MARYKQNSNSKGSLKDIQELINNNFSILDYKIMNALDFKKSIKIEWLSPIKNDDYAEYRDKAFIELLNLNNLKVELKEFWPRMGPQWDGLGRTSENHIFLVEAKANISELTSSPSGAKSLDSINLINKSLDETKNYWDVKKDVNWASYFYQYTNRLAHLYYFRVLNNIPAYLVFIYFIGDKIVDGPSTQDKWKRELICMKNYLGLEENHKLKKYIIDIFIDINNME